MKKQIIKKWYSAIGFPKEYDDEFYYSLEKADTLDFESMETYTNFENKTNNLFAYLYFCEELSQKYKKLGISEEILLDTIRDIVIWTNTYYGIYGVVGLDETGWLRRHLSFKLFKVGRLQYCIADSEFDIESYGVNKGDPVIEVHIPEMGPLGEEDCRKSLDIARAFFQKYFGEYNYKCFTCHSWLLDRALLPYLKEGANITKFMNLFTPVRNDESFALAKYIFRWDVTPETLASFEPRSSFAAKIKSALLSGVKFNETLGVIEK